MVQCHSDQPRRGSHNTLVGNQLCQWSSIGAFTGSCLPAPPSPCWSLYTRQHKTNASLVTDPEVARIRANLVVKRSQRSFPAMGSQMALIAARVSATAGHVPPGLIPFLTSEQRQYGRTPKLRSEHANQSWLGAGRWVNHTRAPDLPCLVCTPGHQLRSFAALPALYTLFAPLSSSPCCPCVYFSSSEFVARGDIFLYLVLLSHPDYFPSASPSSLSFLFYFISSLPPPTYPFLAVSPAFFSSCLAAQYEGEALCWLTLLPSSLHIMILNAHPFYHSPSLLNPTIPPRHRLFA